MAHAALAALREWKSDTQGRFVPIAASALLLVELVKNATLKLYKRHPHWIFTTHADAINPDSLAFIEG